MADLFSDHLKKQAPLADRMRPADFSEFLGQDEIIGPESPLRRAVETEHLESLIFWGPPGSGKTTLAYLIARAIDAHFDEFSAVATGVKEVRQAIERAADRLKFENKKTIVFIDEIHRFNKAQQDILLPHVERGTITLIGATTENPSFEVIAPLLSRSTVYILKPLNEETLKKIIIRALEDSDRGLGQLNLKIDPKAVEYLVSYADGDARAALNGLEFAALYLKSIGHQEINEKEIKEALKQRALRYDKKGEEHYNLISAFIKCMRASDVDAALYWLARMIESGEDPKFIARRMIIFASEDVGLADPEAVQVAAAVVQAVDFVGLPEAQISLAHGTVYLAKAPKNRTAYNALMKAKDDARRGSFGVPMHLRNPVTNLMKEAGYGAPAKEGETNFPQEIGSAKYYDG
ncbi:MAG TPA: replication-associated recombination protein A [Candidatus Pacearchaeota archaeon]|nr:replication-associated recombination protein A [Candidatus Pacearchaeota archaeon]